VEGQVIDGASSSVTVTLILHVPNVPQLVEMVKTTVVIPSGYVPLAFVVPLKLFVTEKPEQLPVTVGLYIHNNCR